MDRWGVMCAGTGRLRVSPLRQRMRPSGFGLDDRFFAERGFAYDEALVVAEVGIRRIQWPRFTFRGTSRLHFVAAHLVVVEAFEPAPEVFGA